MLNIYFQWFLFLNIMKINSPRKLSFFIAIEYAVSPFIFTTRKSAFVDSSSFAVCGLFAWAAYIKAVFPHWNNNKITLTNSNNKMLY